MNPYVLLERAWKSYGVPPLRPRALSAAQARQLEQEQGMGIGRPRLSARQARELEQQMGISVPPVRRSTAGTGTMHVLLEDGSCVERDAHTGADWRQPYGRGPLHIADTPELAAIARRLGVSSIVQRAPCCAEWLAIWPETFWTSIDRATYMVIMKGAELGEPKAIRMLGELEAFCCSALPEVKEALRRRQPLSRRPPVPEPMRTRRGRRVLNPHVRRELATVAATRGCGDRWATPEPSTGYGPRVATLNPPPAAVATVVEARRRYLGTSYVCDVELEHDAELGWHLAFYVPPLSFDVIPPPGEPTPADELSTEFGGMPVRIKGACA